MKMRWGLLGVAAVLTAGATGYGVWQSNQPAPLSSDFASGNGRIEAVDIDIAAKTAGRVREINWPIYTTWARNSLRSPFVTAYSI